MRNAALWSLLLLPASGSAADPSPVRSVAFSPDGKWLAATTGDPKQPGSVVLWDSALRSIRWQHAEAGDVPAVSFSPDSQTFVIACSDGARLLRASDGTLQRTLPHPQEVRAVTFAPDGRRLATACADRRLRVWDLATATVTTTCTGHRERIITLSFSPDGRALLTAAGSEGARLWDAGSGAELRTLKPSSFYTSCARFTPDGGWLLVGIYDGTTRLYNAATGQERARFTGTGGVEDVAFSPAAHTLAIAGYRRSLALFDLTFDRPRGADLERLRALLARLDDDSYEVREAASQQLLQMGFLAEADLERAAHEATSVEVRIRSRRIRKEMLAKPRALLRGHTDEVTSLAFCADVKLLATGSRDGTVRLWDVATLKEVARLVLAR
jgi:WD40 repeat protein